LVVEYDFIGGVALYRKRAVGAYVFKPFLEHDLIVLEAINRNWHRGSRAVLDVHRDAVVGFGNRAKFVIDDVARFDNRPEKPIDVFWRL
jgi:hypothetical protein